MAADPAALVPAGVFLAVGNPLLEIEAHVQLDLLRHFGIQLDNALLAEDRHLPIYEALMTEYEPKFVAGGAAQNTVRVAQWMLGIANATSFVGAIGQDEFGEKLKACIAEDGVTACYQEDDSASTGTCAVLLHEGERALVANIAAANNFLASHLSTDEAEALIEHARFIYIAGFFLTVSLDSILHLARHAVAEDKLFMMNLSAPFLIQFFQDQLAAALPYCDFVFGNENEAMTFAEVKGWAQDVSTIALKIAALPKASGTRPRIVVITQGPNNTTVACQGKVTTYPVDSLYNEMIVDTNGAGDAFVGGFVAQLIKGETLSDCVRGGHFAARIVLQHSCCTFPEVCDFI